MWTVFLCGLRFFVSGKLKAKKQAVKKPASHINRRRRLVEARRRLVVQRRGEMFRLTSLRASHGGSLVFETWQRTRASASSMPDAFLYSADKPTDTCPIALRSRFVELTRGGAAVAVFDKPVAASSSTSSNSSSSSSSDGDRAKEGVLFLKNAIHGLRIVNDPDLVNSSASSRYLFGCILMSLAHVRPSDEGLSGQVHHTTPGRATPGGASTAPPHWRPQLMRPPVCSLPSPTPPPPHTHTHTHTHRTHLDGRGPPHLCSRRPPLPPRHSLPAGPHPGPASLPPRRRRLRRRPAALLCRAGHRRGRGQ